MTAEINVRRLRAGDREAWQRLWDQYLSFYRAELEPGTSDKTFARLCEPGSDLVGLLAVNAEGQALGLAHLIFHATTWAETPYCYLEDLFVDPTSRGSGVGNRLIDTVYASAREHGAGRVYWTTQQFNGAARSLYDTVARLTSFVIYEHVL
jgi:GNAT superfamily N-acetyltransferase